MQQEPEYTTMQILTLHRRQIERLQFLAQAAENRPIQLREMTATVVDAGLKALTPIIAPNSVFVDEV
mgnify:FL=1